MRVGVLCRLGGIPPNERPYRPQHGLVAPARSGIPSLAEAVSFVKSVEYFELTLASGSTTVSANLTKGQSVANCVPFASMMVSGVDDEYDQLFTDVFFQNGPARVTAQRFTSGGTLSVGVFVVEFDPNFVNVHQGTFSLFAGVATTTAAIPLVDLTKAAVVSYYRHGAVTNSWNDYAVAGWFSLANQLSWQRETSAGALDGHYYVFEARNSEFRVQPVSFTLAAGSPTGTAPITAVDMDKSFVIASHRTAYASDDNEDGQIGVFLANPTTVQGQRSFENSGSNLIPDVRAFVVQFGDNVRVQRGALSYNDTDTQANSTIRAVDVPSTLVWNGATIGPGSMESEGTSSLDGDTAFQRLKLANATTVRGDRDGVCGAADCGGIGHYEVIEFNPAGQMLVKSGFYTGDGSGGRPIFVGFTPDVVIVKAGTPSPAADQYAVIRTSTMTGNVSKSPYFGPYPLVDRIQSLDASGFTVGNNPEVNALGTTYYWVAFKAAPGEMKVGSYVGNDSDDRDITGVGFQPECVLVLAADSHWAWHRYAPIVGDMSMTIEGGIPGGGTDRIQAFLADGFQVGTDIDVNDGFPATTYHYIAWNVVPGRTNVGSYAGDGIDNRSIAGVGFLAEHVVVSREQTDATAHKPASTGLSTDTAQWFGGFPASSNTSNLIQALEPDGFQVGDHFSVNGTGANTTYYWVAFGPHAPQANYRSIGTAGPHSAGTITATVGSPVVTGVGTGWTTANRGRGDSITFGGFTETILSVDSETQLTLTSPATVGGSPAYTISRKFMTLTEWEDCIDGGGTSCGPDPVVPSTSLVADDRREVGIAYKDTVFNAGALTNVLIDGSTTDATHTITLTADHGNRHYGVAGAGVILDGGSATDTAVLVFDDFVTVEWLEIRNGGAGFDGVEWQNLAAVNKGVARNLLIHDLPDTGIQIQDSSAIIDIYNNILYRNGRGIRNVSALATGALRIFNNTVFGSTTNGGITASVVTPALITLRNNLSHSNTGGGGDFNVPSPSAVSSHNLAGDTSAVAHSPAGGGRNSEPLPAVAFVSTTGGSENLHIQAGSTAQNNATVLGLFSHDIDAGTRVVPWDIGADDILATTAVELLSFEARVLDSGVELFWETASELKNLGFHLYRGLSPSGPWERITASLIPGLGSSPEGARYNYRDFGLANGTAYFYLLEDVETTGTTKRHGPASATPTAEAGAPPVGRGNSVTYGEPEATSMRVVSRGHSQAVIELTTEGFHAFPQEDGTVKIEIPGFVQAEGEPGLPVKRHWLEAIAGRKVTIRSVRATQVVRFALRPSSAETSELAASWDGTQRLRRARASRLRDETIPGLIPQEAARIAEVAFQGEMKKALLEMAPLRWDSTKGQLVLSRKLLVTVSFQGRERSEIASRDERTGRRTRKTDGPRGVVARLGTTDRGLYGVRYGEIFGPGRLGAQTIRLSRLGRSVPFHLEPDPGRFAPGSTLFFVSEGAGANPYGLEAVYELEVGASSDRMPNETAAPDSTSLGQYRARMVLEEDRWSSRGLRSVALGHASRAEHQRFLLPGKRACELERAGEASGLSPGRERLPRVARPSRSGLCERYFRFRRRVERKGPKGSRHRAAVGRAARGREHARARERRRHRSAVLDGVPRPIRSHLSPARRRRERSSRGDLARGGNGGGLVARREYPRPRCERDRSSMARRRPLPGKRPSLPGGSRPFLSRRGFGVDKAPASPQGFARAVEKEEPPRRLRRHRSPGAPRCREAASRPPAEPGASGGRSTHRRDLRRDGLR